MTNLSVKNQEHLAKMYDVVGLSKERCAAPIQAYLAYAVKENFIGRPIAGYTPDVKDFALMTQKAALALCDVQNLLLEKYNLRLLIWDSYRPKRAVLDFVAWSTAPVPAGQQGEYELERKAIHYPHIEKKDMFDLGYVSADSQHCYGNTVDLGLIDEQGRELPLGAPFDFMDTLSHITNTAKEIGEEAFTNRQILSDAMQACGFIPYEFEFWHFSHKDKEIHEPIDVPMTEDLRGLNVT